MAGSSRLWEVEVMGFGDWVDDAGVEETMGSCLSPQQGWGWRELVPTPWKPLEFNYGGSRVARTQETLAEVHTNPCWKKASSSQSVGDLPQRVVQQQ